jgi:hypothetical protein
MYPALPAMTINTAIHTESIRFLELFMAGKESFFGTLMNADY